MNDINESFEFVDPNREFLKTYLKDGELEELVEQAKLALQNSYSPYSKFAVGACVLTHSGEYFRGTNLENLNFSCSQHAEATAISSALVKGISDFKAIAVTAVAEGYNSIITPCGECRQLLSEYCLFLPIIMVHNTGSIMVEFLHEILPLVPIIFGDKFHGKRKLNKYESAILACNAWVLNDVFPVTRSEMQRLMKDRYYDEINEREIGTLAKRVTEEHHIESPFGCGYDRINPFTINILATSIAKKLTLKSLPYQGVELVNSEDKLIALLRDICYAVFKTHDIDVSSRHAQDSEKLQEENKANESRRLVITIKSDSNPKGPKINLQFSDSQGSKVKFSSLFEGEEQRISTDIRPLFDFKNCKLFPKA